MFLHHRMWRSVALTVVPVPVILQTVDRVLALIQSADQMGAHSNYAALLVAVRLAQVTHPHTQTVGLTAAPTPPASQQAQTMRFNALGTSTRTVMDAWNW